MDGIGARSMPGLSAALANRPTPKMHLRVDIWCIWLVISFYLCTNNRVRRAQTHTSQIKVKNNGDQPQSVCSHDLVALLSPQMHRDRHWGA